MSPPKCQRRGFIRSIFAVVIGVFSLKVKTKPQTKTDPIRAGTAFVRLTTKSPGHPNGMISQSVLDIRKK